MRLYYILSSSAKMWVMLATNWRGQLDTGGMYKLTSVISALSLVVIRRKRYVHFSVLNVVFD